MPRKKYVITRKEGKKWVETWWAVDSAVVGDEPKTTTSKKRAEKGLRQAVKAYPMHTYRIEERIGASNE